MRKNIYTIIMIAICIMTLATNNVMATNTTSVTTEQGHPKYHKLKTTSVKLRKATQLQKNQIVSQLIAVKGIKNAYFKGNTVYISYNPKRITSANAQAYAKSAYNSVVAKKHHQAPHQAPQAGRYGNEPQNQPKPHSNMPKSNHDNHNHQPKTGRK